MPHWKALLVTVRSSPRKLTTSVFALFIRTLIVAITSCLWATKCIVHNITAILQWDSDDNHRHYKKAQPQTLS
jgi:hypothetical protein